MVGDALTALNLASVDSTFFAVVFAPKLEGNHLFVAVVGFRGAIWRNALSLITHRHLRTHLNLSSQRLASSLPGAKPVGRAPPGKGIGAELFLLWLDAMHCETRIP